MSELDKEEEERVRNMIRQYAKELEEKMNFRLLLDQESRNDKCFFVEHIGVTDILFSRRTEEKKIGGKIRNSLIKLFRRVMAGIRSLFFRKWDGFTNDKK